MISFDLVIYILRLKYKDELSELMECEKMETNEIQAMLIKIRDEYIESESEELKLTDDTEETEICQQAIRNLESMTVKDFEYIESKIYEMFEQIMNED